MTGPTLRDAERYVGMPYQPGVFDCASLTVLVQHDLFNREIRLPPASDRSQGRRGQAREVDRQGYARPITAPETGCAALFLQSGGYWHIGTVFMHLGVAWVLHASNETQGVALQRLTDITRQGMHLEGFYQWI